MHDEIISHVCSLLKRMNEFIISFISSFMCWVVDSYIFIRFYTIFLQPSDQRNKWIVLFVIKWKKNTWMVCGIWTPRKMGQSSKRHNIAMEFLYLVSVINWSHRIKWSIKRKLYWLFLLYFCCCCFGLFHSWTFPLSYLIFCQMRLMCGYHIHFFRITTTRWFHKTTLFSFSHSSTTSFP